MTDHEQSEQERGRQLVHREVMACLSSLVSTLASGYGALPSGADYPHKAAGRTAHAQLANLCEQAFELASPIQDYEEAAIQEGWTRDGSGVFILKDEQASEVDPTGPNAWQELCEEQGLEPYEREVYEFWAVSDWFGRKLADQGERVDFDFGNLVVWARTTTGQAIYCDGVVERIVRDLWKPEPAPEPAPKPEPSPYEVAARAEGWEWDEGGPHFYRNRPGASLLEPYEYMHASDCDWFALCLEQGIKTPEA